ncbi:AraC family transcriptional regulator [Maribellus luteus]|uniref:AraC family transcriptional regulator n=1 Tax=Maribellus luteus TaxID=2305463 RepID=A0A399T5K1_9BACT|nr:AraC family transcriptional regulator [Maribellus luteus]RIJ50409.1 AraC family transcriptional regulator [Maribellus luteus]
MSSILINTIPQQKFLYTVKTYKEKVFHLPFHRHDRYELTYIIRGKGTRIIGDTIKEYKSGDIVLMAPNIPHHWQSEWTGDKSVAAITVFFSEDFPSPDFKLLSEFDNITELLKTSRFGIELKGELRKKIQRKLMKLTNGHTLNQIINIINILSSIAKSKEYIILMDRGFSSPKHGDLDRITELVKYIQENITRKITIDDLANKVHMHTGSVNRFFKQATGFSLIEYINLMRIGMACELLTGTEKKTADIAFECGFNNLSHFNRTFKRVKNTTPKEFRSQVM